MVRVTLKQALPLVFLFAGTAIAQGNNDIPTVTMIARADNTQDNKDSNQASKTADAKKDDSKTEEAKSETTSDSKDSKDNKDSKDSKQTTSKKDEQKTTTKESLVTDTWEAQPQNTAAPDLNSGKTLRDGSILGLTIAVGVLTMGMALI